MNTKLSVTLSLAAGLAGGILSRYVAPDLVHAQAQSVPREIAARTFVLTDASGNRLGALTVSQNGRPSISLTYHGKTVFIDPMLAMEKNAVLNVSTR